MPSQPQNNQQQMVVYALVAIAVLLMIIVGVMLYNNMNNVPSPTASSTTAPPQDIASQMPAPAQPVEFDEKTATKLPAGMTPEKALKTYMENVMAKKWKEAYELLPLAQKNSYGSAEAYGQQVATYNIKGYEIGKPQSVGTDVTIVSQQNAQMNVSYTWTYTKVKDTWYVKSRAMGGSVQ
jgi:hypothetical protein